MSNGLVVADIPGAVSRGLQFRQQQQLAPLQQQQAQLGIQRQQQQFKLGGLSVQQAERENEAARELGAFTKNVNSAIELNSVPDEQKAAFLENKIASADPSRDMTQSKKALEIVRSGGFDELRQGAEQLISVAQQRGVIPRQQQAPGAGQFTIGNTRFDAQGNVVAEGARTPRKLSSIQQKVEAEGIDPISKAGFKRAREITQGSRTDPSLTPSKQQVLAKASEGQLASAGFANRVNASNDILTILEGTEGFDPTSIASAALGEIPFGNILQSTEHQQYIQAKRDFITAVLRKESGAAIGADEFANEDKKFFPQIGDKPEVLERKRQGRARAFDNLKKQSKGVFDVQFKEAKDLKTLSDQELMDF